MKFSKDGRELVVGNSNESICIYDLRANKVTERIHAHVRRLEDGEKGTRERRPSATAAHAQPR
uniref:Anaphase-promoting complex subunit 4 WD40 domain-containing protein n=1 Tax=Aegilops tauschii subsp. strangulata TaxID=200361 RepID=A0A453CI86_AEGTS